MATALSRHKSITNVTSEYFRPNGAIITEHTPLTVKEQRFVDEFVATGSALMALKNAGYRANHKPAIYTQAQLQELTQSEDKPTIGKIDTSLANRLLAQPHIKKAIADSMKSFKHGSIMTGQEVMAYFSAVVRGELKDQFGLDISIADRTKAAIELAKRTVDIEQKQSANAIPPVQISINWKRE